MMRFPFKKKRSLLEALPWLSGSKPGASPSDELETAGRATEGLGEASGGGAGIVGGRGSMSGFQPSPNFTRERAMRMYKNAIEAGFSKSEAMERVKGAQRQVEKIAKNGLSEKRDVTSQTYKNALNRNKKLVDELFKGR